MAQARPLINAARVKQQLLDVLAEIDASYTLKSNDDECQSRYQTLKARKRFRAVINKIDPDYHTAADIIWSLYHLYGYLPTDRCLLDKRDELLNLLLRPDQQTGATIEKSIEAAYLCRNDALVQLTQVAHPMISVLTEQNVDEVIDTFLTVMQAPKFQKKQQQKIQNIKRILEAAKKLNATSAEVILAVKRYCIDFRKSKPLTVSLFISALEKATEQVLNFEPLSYYEAAGIMSRLEHLIAYPKSYAREDIAVRVLQGQFSDAPQQLAHAEDKEDKISADEKSAMDNVNKALKEIIRVYKKECLKKRIGVEGHNRYERFVRMTKNIKPDCTPADIVYALDLFCKTEVRGRLVKVIQQQLRNVAITISNVEVLHSNGFTSKINEQNAKNLHVASSLVFEAVHSNLYTPGIRKYFENFIDKNEKPYLHGLFKREKDKTFELIKTFKLVLEQLSAEVRPIDAIDIICEFCRRNNVQGKFIEKVLKKLADILSVTSAKVMLPHRNAILKNIYTIIDTQLKCVADTRINLADVFALVEKKQAEQEQRFQKESERDVTVTLSVLGN